METEIGDKVVKKLTKRFYLYFFLVSLAVAGVLSYFASSSPDGLEKVAEDTGFLDSAQDSAVSDSPLADYGVAGLEDERLSVGLSGILGVLVTALLAFGVFALVRRMNKGSRN